MNIGKMGEEDGLGREGLSGKEGGRGWDGRDRREEEGISMGREESRREEEYSII
jgi:hypothetical protein